MEFRPEIERTKIDKTLFVRHATLKLVAKDLQGAKEDAGKSAKKMAEIAQHARDIDGRLQEIESKSPAARRMNRMAKASNSSLVPKPDAPGRGSQRSLGGQPAAKIPPQPRPKRAPSAKKADKPEQMKIEEPDGPLIKPVATGLDQETIEEKDEELRSQAS
jgi:hypothetical protein